MHIKKHLVCLLSAFCFVNEALQKGVISSPLCSVFRMRRSRTVQTLFTKGGGDSSIWMRFVNTMLGVCVHMHFVILLYFWVFFSALLQATNMRSNGSSVQHEREPKENKVRSMASQLQAKFENKNSYTFQKTQVKHHNMSDVVQCFCCCVANLSIQAYIVLKVILGNLNIWYIFSSVLDV